MRNGECVSTRQSAAPSVEHLHRALLHGDTHAGVCLTDLLFRSVLNRVRRRFPSTAADVLSDGTADAFLDHLAHPEKFCADKGLSLDAYLYMASWRNVANLIRAAKRREARESPIDSEVQDMTVPWDSGRTLAAAEALRSCLGMLETRDRELLLMQAAGERSTRAFARLLGIADRPTYVQRREVKRAKDRIHKTLKRRGINASLVRR